LVSADTPIAQLAGPAVINSVLAGSDAVLIVGGVTSLNNYLMGRPEIKTPEQLKGGSVAISRFGSSSDLSLATLCTFLSFVRELDHSGYIDALYKKR
jgi:hypothetical protein